MTYEQAKKDHAYLWAINPADDMTGGYVDQEDLERMLNTPTKTMARYCLCSQIDYWFSVGPDPYSVPSGDSRYYVENDPEVKKIAERHGKL